MTDIWKYLKETDKPIVLYGTGNGADKIMARLNADNIKISGIFSSDGFKKNKEFYGHSVCDYKTLKEKLGDMIILMCFGSDRDEVLQNVRRLSSENEFYAPDVPVYGKEIFDIPFAIQNADKLKTVYDILADEQSKKVFENTVYFKLTGKPQYLYDIESERSEVFEILKLNGNESFLDLGAFNGDTVAEFINQVKTYKSITAVEPDSRNFKRLKANTEGLQNITLINSAIADTIGTVNFSKQHGRGLGDTSKTVEVSCTTVDEISKAEKPTYIKMDVEGNEIKTINGAKNTIREFMPKLKIAAYHNSTDIFEVPLLIKSISPQYKIYMRHHKSLPAWDIDYIFV